MGGEVGVGSLLRCEMVTWRGRVLVVCHGVTWWIGGLVRERLVLVVCHGVTW